jgi:branched-chain amino acid aminotransferase
VYGAEEACVTGTFAGLTPVREIDGRVMGNGKRGPMVARLQQLYMQLVKDDSAKGPRV